MSRLSNWYMFSIYYDVSENSVSSNILPVFCSNPHIQFSKLRARVADNRLIHIVPKWHASWLSGTLNVFWHQNGTISSSLNRTSRQTYVVSISWSCRVIILGVWVAGRCFASSRGRLQKVQTASTWATSAGKGSSFNPIPVYFIDVVTSDRIFPSTKVVFKSAIPSVRWCYLWWCLNNRCIYDK